MNVGIAVHNYDSSEGTGGYVAELLPRIADEHKVTLYAARVRAAVPSGVRVITVPAVMARAYTAILTFPAAFRAVRKAHDLVHAQGWVTGSADVVTAHIVMAGWRAAAKKAGVRSPTGERFLGGFVQAQEARLFRMGTRHVIAPSRKVKTELARHYGRADGVTVVPHGFLQPPATVDRASARHRFRLPADAPVALFVGDIRKGLDVAIRAVGRTPGVHLAIVSRSSPDEVLGFARAAGIGDRVHWLGTLLDPAPAFGAADILLHPTIYDSFGLVVAEAMAFGVPPIVTAAAGISELIEHERSGWIVRGDPLEGTLEGITALTADPERRSRMGEAARTYAATRSWDVVAEETMAVYEQVYRRALRGEAGSGKREE